MNSHEDSSYRLDLARGYLLEAQADLQSKRWHSALANSQEAVENAGKSILLHFRPLPTTHDILEFIAALVKTKLVPETIRAQIQNEMDAFHEMGTKTHIRVTYGDERARVPPWKLIQEAEALAGFEKARRAITLAEKIFDEMTKPPPQEKN